MKMYALLFIIGAFLGGFVSYKLQPKPETLTKELIRNNVITVTKTNKDGTVVTKTVDKSEQVKQATLAPVLRNNLLGFKYSFDGGKELTYGRQALLPNLYFTLSVSQVQQDFVAGVGIIYTF
jgi:hypothetical protein